MFDKNVWALYAVIAGGLMGVGVLFTNALTSAKIPLPATLAVFGTTWLIMGSLSGQLAGLKGVGLIQMVLLLAAAILFFFGNVIQFKAFARAPLTGYAVIVVTVVTVLITTAYETFLHWKKGTFEVSVPQIVATVLGLASVVIFMVFQKK